MVPVRPWPYDPRLRELLDYIAFLPEHGDPRVRIDLLFPSDAAERKAVQHPSVGRIGGVQAKVIRVEMLAMMKFISDRPSDRSDFDAMLERGLFEPETVRILLAHAEPGAVAGYDRHIRRRRPR
jgi:hypothetical protein